MVDVVVYGVLVPGCEGRVGMAAIVEDLGKFITFYFIRFYFTKLQLRNKARMIIDVRSRKPGMGRRLLDSSYVLNSPINMRLGSCALSV